MAIFKDYLENKSPLILHGALGTEMESLGYDISGKLWSAKYLLDKPEVIQKIITQALHLCSQSPMKNEGRFIL